MTVSFDLDDTLFVSEREFDVEPERPFPLNRIYGFKTFIVGKHDEAWADRIKTKIQKEMKRKGLTSAQP